MKTATVKDKHLRLDQTKIRRAREILGVRTETEAVEKALELVIATDSRTVRRNEIFKRVLTRRERLKTIKGDVADWVLEGRNERDKIYGG